MSNAEFALVVSMASIIVGSLALGWNIYRDPVLKAHVDVSFAVGTINHQSSPHRPQYLKLKVTNFGPGPVNISAIVAKDARQWRRLLRKIRWAMIKPDYNNPMSVRAPRHQLKRAYEPWRKDFASEA